MLNPEAKPFVYHKPWLPFPFYHAPPRVPFLCGFHPFDKVYTAYASPPPFSTTTTTTTLNHNYTNNTNTSDATAVKGVGMTKKSKRGCFVGGYHKGRKSHDRLMMWIRKEAKKNGFEGRVDSSPFHFNEKQAHLHSKTTVMIKNIPSKFSRKMLVDLVDSHCAQENRHSSPHLSEYDFLYLPMDFTSGLNLGYAFVNFTSVVGAVKFYRSFHNHKWEVFGSNKICEIKHARLQGKNALVGRFRNSYFLCDSDELLPILFSPPRNGSTSCPPPSIVGRLKAQCRA